MARLFPSSLPFLGAGIGYRSRLGAFFARVDRHLGFFEVMPEHALEGNAATRAALVAATRRKPVVTHSVTLSVGTATGADMAFAPKFAKVNRLLRAHWASDHLCFTKAGDRTIGQLTPFPYTEEALRATVRNVRAVQAALGVPFLLENISQYFQFQGADFTEPEFFAEVVRKTGCGVLLDVTNLRNNAVNLGLDRARYLDAFPLESVVQLHLAGSEHVGGKLLDTHGAPIHEEVWAMTERLVQEHPVRALLIERDQTFGPLPQLAGELKRGAQVMAQAMGAP